MKRISIFLFLLCIIALTACSVKSSEEHLCISDEYTVAQTPFFALNADIPDDAIALNDPSADSVLYVQGDYDIFRETFGADSAEDGIKRITGKDYDQLNVICLSAFPQEEYRFSWTVAGESGDLACCATMLFDGKTCYTLSIQCPAALENQYRSAFYHILSNVDLQPV